LTAGWRPPFAEDDELKPYADVLRKNRPECDIIELGCPGESARHMITRLPTVLKENSAETIIILAGTNDIGKPSEDTESIFESLMTLYQTCLDAQMYVVAVTIPYHGLESDKGYEFIGERRKAINAQIKDASHASNMTCVDLAKEFKPFGDPEYWDDMLHFTPKGYELLGSIILKGLPRAKKESE
jgi:lysophospholipase L1-like esterase